jgi:two-component system sensor histidine kinase/response regulator
MRVGRGEKLGFEARLRGIHNGPVFSVLSTLWVIGAAEPGAAPSDPTPLLILGAAAIVAAILVWQNNKAKKQFQLDLAEERERNRLVAQEKELLARENQSKSEMLATLSREIRANLNGIMGSADLLIDDAASRLQREHLTTLRSSAEALHMSLNDVLDYASIETGRIHVAREDYDLRQPLYEVIEQLLPLASLKNLDLVLVLSPEVPVNLVGDRARLRQILLNLLSNAITFTPSGRVVLRVELPQRSGSTPPQSASWLHFTISDTGPEIPEEMQAGLFDRFTRPDGQSPRQTSGAGLGLAICKQLVELMGGQIGVRNGADSGVEVWLMLPISAGRRQPEPAAPAGLYAVVLDAEPVTRVATSSVLSRLGIEQDTTDSVSDAAVLLREARKEGVTEPILVLGEVVAREKAAALSEALTAEPRVPFPRIVLLAKDPDAVAIADFNFPVHAVLRRPLLRSEPVLRAITESAESLVPFNVNTEAARTKPMVLVVDDDDVSRSVTSKLLSRLGCRIEVSPSGDDAIAKAGRIAFDLVLMDCQMPGMDGFTATGRIRELRGTKCPPIVALTANTSSKDREDCIAAGMCDFIDKPVRKFELARVLKRWATKLPA